jgi:hypothetical protein
VSTALLIEEGWHSTMMLATALEDAGYAVTVLTANGSKARARRRSVQWLSGPAIASDHFLPHVGELATHFDHVLPLTERAMLRLATVPWRDRIFPPLDGEQQTLIANKHALVEAMGARGIAIPRHVRVTSALDLDRIELPAVVKAATGSAGKLVRIVDTRSALATTIARAGELGGEWIVQQYVPSATFLFGGLFHRGEPLRIYAGEKLELYPPRTGGAIRMRSTRDHALIEIGTRVMRALRWTGFASADFVRDARGYLLLEVNPRLWGSIAAARATGVDLFSPFAQLLGGSTPAPDLAFADGQECSIFPRYLYAAHHRNAAGAKQALRDLRGFQGDDWRDPGFVLHILKRLYWLRRLGPRI